MFVAPHPPKINNKSSWSITLTCDVHVGKEDGSDSMPIVNTWTVVYLSSPRVIVGGLVKWDQ